MRSLPSNFDYFIGANKKPKDTATMTEKFKKCEKGKHWSTNSKRIYGDIVR